MIKSKTTKFLRQIATVILTAVICLGSVIPAFATVEPSAEDKPAAAAITKNLNMPEGTTTPGATFTFTFTKKSIDDKDVGLDTMPVIGPINIGFTGNDTGTTKESVKTVIRESDNVLNGITFPHAGVYVYEIEEVQSVTGYKPGSNETYTYSPAKYTITIYVKNKNSDLYVAAITSSIVTKDSESQASQTGEKIDPTPGGGTDGNYSKMIFTNTYLKAGGGSDPTNSDNHVLTVSKAVVGDYADRTRYFAFAITVTRPAGISKETIYKAYVMNKDATQVETSEKNYNSLSTDNNNFKYIEFTTGTPLTVNLRHDQKLVFNDLHIGSSYVAVESAVEHYIAAADVTVNGGTAINLKNDSHNTALSTETRMIGENKNIAAFTNTYRSITPTGVVINNLPFILILLLAAGALIGFIVVKSRKKNRYLS